MSEKKPLTERIIEAFRAHGNMTLDQLAKHAETSVATLYTMTGSLKKQHGIVRLPQQKAGPSTYGFATTPENKRAPVPKKPKPAPPSRVNGAAPYAAALQGLRAKRSELALELSKVDHAIEAIGALTE
jgi:hypothetical protein